MLPSTLTRVGNGREHVFLKKNSTDLSWETTGFLKDRKNTRKTAWKKEMMERLDWKARICFLICATVPIPYQFHPERVKSAQVYRCDKLDLWSWQDSLNRGKYSAVQPKTPTSRSGSKRGESLAFLYPHHLILYYTNWYDLYCIYIYVYIHLWIYIYMYILA